MNRSPLPRRKTRIRSRSRTNRPPPGKDLAYRRWHHSQPCLIRDQHECGYYPPDRTTNEPAHVRPFGSSRIDRENIVTLCPLAHDLQEGRTEAFEREFRKDLTAEAIAADRRYREAWG